MKAKELMKNAPNSVIIVCATAIAIALLGAFVFLLNNGKDTTELSRLVNTGLNFVMVIIGSVGAVAAGSAAKTSAEAKDAAQQAVQQTNGALDKRIEDGVMTALERRANGERAPILPGEDQPPLI